MGIPMKKTMRRLLLYGIVLLFFPSSVFAGLVPDTGQNKCYDNSVIIPCPSIGQPFYGQDASYATNPASYTKLDINGSILPDNFLFGFAPNGDMNLFQGAIFRFVP